MRFSIFAFGLVSLLPVHAAETKERQQRAEAPVLGYVASASSGELRAILGVPGASRWSEPIALPENAGNLRIASGHRWALSHSGGETSILTLDTLQITPLSGAGPFEQAIFSPTGRAVALRRGASVAVYTGLPEAPAKSAELQSSDLASSALSDDGSVAAIREGRIVNAITGDFLYNCVSDCKIAYFPGTSSNLAVFDSGRLLELRGGEAKGIAEALPIASVTRFAVSASRLALATEERFLTVERSSGGIVTDQSMTGNDRLEALRLPGSWLLSAAQDSAAWLYSNDGVGFVPAAVRSKD